MLKHLFIIPVHESNDCLIDTLDNIIRFNPDIEPLFVIYISDFFHDFDPSRLSPYPNVLITRKLRKHHGQRYESQYEAYVKAYRLARAHFRDFDYVSVFHSSQLFIKFGYADYITQFDYAYKPLSEEEPLPVRYHPIMGTDAFLKWFPPGRSDLYNYQVVEAGFFTKAMFDQIEQEVEEMPINMTLLNDYFHFTPIEEIMIPTLAVQIGAKLGLKRGDNIMRFVDVEQPFELDAAKFTVKSVPRDLNHHLRVKCRNMTKS